MSYTHYGFPLILLEGVTAGFLYRSPRLRHFLLRHPGEIVLHWKSGGSDLWSRQKGAISYLGHKSFTDHCFEIQISSLLTKGRLELHKRNSLSSAPMENQRFPVWTACHVWINLVLAATSPWLPTQGWQRFSSACPHGPSHGKAPDVSTLTTGAPESAATHAPRMPAVNGLSRLEYLKLSSICISLEVIKDRSSWDTSLAISSKWMQPTDHKSTAWQVLNVNGPSPEYANHIETIIL
jgi:hypothetical protein